MKNRKACYAFWAQFVVVGYVVIEVFGCGKSQDVPRPTDPPPLGSAPAGAGAEPRGGARAGELLKETGGYEVAAVKAHGSLQATAIYTGNPIPEPSEVPVNIDVPHCGRKVFTENLLVDKASRGLKNVVVRLERITKGKAPPETVTVTNRNCAFVPHVAAAMKGTKLEFLNEDPILHNTHPYLAQASFFNLSLRAGDLPPRPRPIPQAGLMEIKCDIHKWMSAYVVVHTNPYIAVSDAQGKLTIDGVPPGKHRYVVWHEQLGEKSGEVEIQAGQSAELKLEFAPSE